jgi:hypothetical protein
MWVHITLGVVSLKDASGDIGDTGSRYGYIIYIG